VDEFLVNYVLIPNHRQHVFRDLMAYCCTFEHCDSGLFESRIAWKDHEIAEHRRDWRCPSCQHGFGTRDLVAQHILAEHPATEDGLLYALVTAASPQRASAKISDCPFCDRHHARSNLLHPEPVPIQHEQDFYDVQVSIDVYQRHLSHHMEQLALFAVPPADNDGDDSDATEDDIVASDEDSDEDDEEDEDDEDEHVSDSFVSNAVSSPDVQATLSGTVLHDHVTSHDEQQQQLDSEAQPHGANIDDTIPYVCSICGHVPRDLAGRRYGLKEERGRNPAANRC
jgi:rubrerythrin